MENSAKPYYYNSVTKETQWEVPKVIVKVEVGPVVTKPVFKGEEYIAEIIAKEDARVKAEEEEKKRLEEEEEKRKLRVKKKGEGNKDKKVMALFSTIVVQVMSKYKSHLDQDQFKKRAREVSFLFSLSLFLFLLSSLLILSPLAHSNPLRKREETSKLLQRTLRQTNSRQSV